MPSKYKCPVCGCTEYYSLSGSSTSTHSTFNGTHNENDGSKSLISADLDIYCAEHLDIRSFGVSLNAEVCLCKNCGHIDLFNESRVRHFQSEKERLDNELRAKESELSNLKEEQKKIENELASMRERTQAIAKLLTDEDITIRQHKELEQEAQEINSKRPQLEKRLAQLTNEIGQTEREYSSLSLKLGKVTPNN